MKAMTIRDITAQPVTFEFVTSSTPIELVQQYYKLRQDVYTNYWQLKQFSGDEDEYDKAAIILLMIHEDRCVGGGRLIIHQAHSGRILPMETPEFRVADLFPELELEGKNYVEISRFVILPEFMTGSYSTEMYVHIAQKCKELDIPYGFAVSNISHARKIRIGCKTFGLQTKIRNDIRIPALPTYEEIEMRISIIDFASWNNKASDT